MKKYNQSHQRLRGGFTLVELLVVIGIIAALIGMLLPVLNRAKSAAQDVTCKSNLRQVGTSLAMYMVDSRGRFPYGNTFSFGPNPVGETFHAPLSRYTCPSYDNYLIPWEAKNNFVIGAKTNMPKGIWTCPTIATISNVLEASGCHGVFAANAKFFVDKYNIWDTAVVYPQVNISRVRNTARKIVFVEYNMNGQDVNTVDFDPAPTLDTPISTDFDFDCTWKQYGSNNNYLRYRHNGRANALLADLHVEGLLKGSVTPAQFAITP